MDMLSDILRLGGLTTAVLGHAKMYGDWGVLVQESSEMALHVMRKGECWFQKDEASEPFLLAEGDILLATRGFSHGISDKPRRPLQELGDVLETMGRRASAKDDWSSYCEVLCAKYMVALPGGAPMIGRLPDLVHLKREHVAGQGRLTALLDILDAEARDGGGGSDLVVSRLVDTLLIFILRRWFEVSGPAAPAWYRALEDPGVGAALAAVHNAPNEAWTIDQLAEIARQSRATFLRRFREVTGEAPMAYVTRWRMALAAKALKGSAIGVEQVAHEAGYDSAAAFSKAFRRAFGVSPRDYRLEMA